MKRLLKILFLWHTLFTDKDLVEHFIKEKYSQNEKVMNKTKVLKSLRFNDFGRLSACFLQELHPINFETGELIENESIISLLYNTNLTLNEILFNEKYNFQAALSLINGDESNGVSYNDVEQMYISPLVKRGVWQAISMVKEYVEVLKQEPKKIFVEVARTNKDNKKGKGTISRLERIRDLYKNCGKICDDYNNLINQLNQKNESDLRQERLFLYFMQQGICAYTGERIVFSNLSSDMYDVDHIIPQSMVKDDSLENKVLVKREANMLKRDVYPLSTQVICNNRKQWEIWKENNFISENKFKRLIKSELTAADLEGFVARQMVVTNQSAKAICQLLKKAYPNSDVIYSKAENVSDFRNKYNIVKFRGLNNLHHAVDAYLNIVVGNVYHTRFSGNYRKHFEARNNMQRIFNFDKIYDNKIEGAWDGENSLIFVKKTAQKNSMQVTRLPLTMKGKFYDETVHPGETAEFPRKGRKHCLSLTDSEGKLKYGGYKKLKNAYFMVIESLDKKGIKQLTIEGVPVIYDYEMNGNEEKLIKMYEEYHGLIEPKIIINKIKIQSLLKVNGSLFYLSGKQGESFSLRNANEWFVNNERASYFKILDKFINLFDAKSISPDVAELSEYAVSPSRDDGKKRAISKEKNILEFENIINQLKKSIYCGLTGNGNVAEYAEKNKQKFINLNLVDQARLLLNLVVQLKCTAERTDLSLLGGSKNSGILTLSKKITDKNISIIHKSITGVYEKEIIINKVTKE